MNKNDLVHLAMMQLQQSVQSMTDNEKELSFADDVAEEMIDLYTNDTV